jgi:hypothetical protein
MQARRRDLSTGAVTPPTAPHLVRLHLSQVKRVRAITTVTKKFFQTSGLFLTF